MTNPTPNQPSSAVDKLASFSLTDLMHQSHDGTERYVYKRDAAQIITAQEQRLGELTEALEDLTCQFAYWNEGVGGISTGGLSALETAFALLGWDDPHALPSGCCDEPGCKKQISCGTPTPSGYRNTCHEHRPKVLPPYAAPDCEPPRETSE